MLHNPSEYVSLQDLDELSRQERFLGTTDQVLSGPMFCVHFQLSSIVFISAMDCYDCFMLLIWIFPMRFLYTAYLIVMCFLHWSVAYVSFKTPLNSNFVNP